MGSSISHQGHETVSAVRTETETGSHNFTVFGYSMTKGIGIGKCIDSDLFTIGGYDWVIRYYPDGENNIYMSFFLDLKSKDTDVKAKFVFTMLQHNGVPSNMRQSSGLITFRSTASPNSSWGYYQFIKRAEFEASECLKDDAFTLKCTVTVVKGTKIEKNSPFGITVPPSKLNQNLADLLESGKGADITFVVNKEKFRAHRGILATRSAVFNAMLFGGMKEKGTDSIIINDIEAPVFKSMLHFIYSDSLPNLEGKQDMRLMAEYLLVAADRYQLERLRLLCEDVLHKNLDVNNAATTLLMAERHNCSQLKAQCLKFMSSAEVFKEVALNPEFQNLMTVCPSVLKDIKALKFKI